MNANDWNELKGLWKECTHRDVPRMIDLEQKALLDLHERLNQWSKVVSGNAKLDAPRIIEHDQMLERIAKLEKEMEGIGLQLAECGNENVMIHRRLEKLETAHTIESEFTQTIDGRLAKLERSHSTPRENLQSGKNTPLVPSEGDNGTLISFLKNKSLCPYCGHILTVSDHYCELCKESISVATDTDGLIKDIQNYAPAKEEKDKGLMSAMVGDSEVSDPSLLQERNYVYPPMLSVIAWLDYMKARIVSQKNPLGNFKDIEGSWKDGWDAAMQEKKED